MIGLTTYEEQARWGVWDSPAVLLPSTYVRSVLAAGGMAVLLPPVVEAVIEMLPRLDGLILSGGPDIDPARYRQPALATTGPPRPRRDEAESAIVHAATRSGTPLLGICRGLQMINVARGGTLIQHLPDVLGSTEHAPAPAVYGWHPISITAGSGLAAAVGLGSLEVPCYHHQAIDELGSGLSVSARALDGTIEAVEDDSLPFFVAVQWHPEVDDDVCLFKALVTASRRPA